MFCKYCNKEFSSERAINTHMGLKHKKEYHDNYMNSNVVISEDELDITNLELQNIRKLHSGRCDICGKYETANTRPDCKSTPNKLCVDHNHNTNQFRGFICVQCNRNMGWLDKYGDQIEAYNKPYKSKVKK